MHGLLVFLFVVVGASEVGVTFVATCRALEGDPLMEVEPSSVYYTLFCCILACIVAVYWGIASIGAARINR